MSIDYVSNLKAPDLRPYFKHLHWREMGHSFGHLVASDWADKADDDPVFGLYKKCGLWTRDEAAILYQIARIVGGDWLDIGCHTGWTTRHIAEGVQDSGKVRSFGGIWAVDPMLTVEDFSNRCVVNACEGLEIVDVVLVEKTSTAHFGELSKWVRYDGICIDGDHEPGKPLEDAINSAKHLKPGGVILFHDFVGLPVREAVAHLIDHEGFMCRIYLTPHVVAVCWRGQSADDLSEFHPPIHIPEQGIVEQKLFDRWPEWDWKVYS